MIRGITEAIGDGAAGTTLGTMADTGEATRGILTMPDGTEDGIRIGAITTMDPHMARDSVLNTVTGEGTGCTSLVMRPKDAKEYSQEGRRQPEGASAQAAASAEVRQAPARHEVYQAQ